MCVCVRGSVGCTYHIAGNFRGIKFRRSDFLGVKFVDTIVHVGCMLYVWVYVIGGC